MPGNPAMCGPFPPKNTTAIEFQGQNGSVTYATRLRPCPRKSVSEGVMLFGVYLEFELHNL